MITRSESPANRRTFGRNAVTKSAATPIVTSTSIVGCAHEWNSGARFMISRWVATVRPTMRCDEERRRRVAPDRAQRARPCRCR